jgi:hypothetical protein
MGEIVLPKQALVLKIRWFRRCTVCRLFRGMSHINQLPTDVLHRAPICITGWALPAIISLKFLGLDSWLSSSLPEILGCYWIVYQLYSKQIHQTCTTWECHPDESFSHFDDLVQWYCAIMIWPKAFIDRHIQFKVKGTNCTPFFQFLFWSG